MQDFSEKELKKLYISSVNSHKGQNGKLLLISGSKLFHSSSLWGLKVASRIVDMVFYSSVDENNKIVQDLKKEFRDGIVVPRSKIEDYIKEINKDIEFYENFISRNVRSFSCRGAGAVKRTSLKSWWLSVYAGSNPVPGIIRLVHYLIMKKSVYFILLFLLKIPNK